MVLVWFRVPFRQLIRLPIRRRNLMQRRRDSSPFVYGPPLRRLLRGPSDLKAVDFLLTSATPVARATGWICFEVG